MMSPDLKDAMLCTDTYCKKSILLIGKMHPSFVFNNKNKEVLEMIEYTLISFN